MNQDYLQGKLLPTEIVYLKKIIKSARIDYLRKIKEVHFETVDIELIDVKEYKTVDDEVFNKFDELISVNDIERIFEDKNMSKAIKILTNKERLVFFYCFLKNKKEKDIAKELNVSRGRIPQIKLEIKKKILEQYNKLKGEQK